MSQNAWAMLAANVREDLRNKLTDPDVYGDYGNADNGRKDVPGARSFNDWYKQYYVPPGGLRPRVERLKVFAEWRFNHALTSDERNSFLCVYAKVKAEGLWEQVKTVNWVGDRGQILFVPVLTQDALRDLLRSSGYGDWWFASHKCKWGLRSRFRGTQLHFRGEGEKRVNVHIDIHNPGDPTTPGAEPTNALEELGQAITHSRLDDKQRGSTHTPPQLRAALNAAGLAVLSVP
jgi:hypothetical protein